MTQARMRRFISSRVFSLSLASLCFTLLCSALLCLAFTSHTDTFSITMWTRRKERKNIASQEKEQSLCPCMKWGKATFPLSLVILTVQLNASWAKDIKYRTLWISLSLSSLAIVMMKKQMPPSSQDTATSSSIAFTCVSYTHILLLFFPPSLSLSVLYLLRLCRAHTTRAHSETFVKWNKWSKTGRKWLMRQLIEETPASLSYYQSACDSWSAFVASHHIVTLLRQRKRAKRKQRKRERERIEDRATVTFEPEAVVSIVLFHSCLASRLFAFSLAIHSSHCNLITIEESRRGEERRGEDLLTLVK